MDTGLEQFYEVFFEESKELLADMETCLLGLDVNSPDPEDLNAIFRAAHSIKGGAGTFGFTDMTETTHMLESLLDKLRKGEIEIRSEMIDTFLSAGDVLKGQLAAHRGDGDADEMAAAKVCKELKQFSEQSAVAGVSQVSVSIDENQGEAAAEIVGEAKTAVAEVEKTEAIQPKISQPESANFYIEFSCEGVNEKTKDNLLINLRAMGNLEKITLPTEVEQICKLRLTTSADEEDLWEALAFVVDPANLKVEKEEIMLSDLQDKVVSVEAVATTTSNSVTEESAIRDKSDVKKPYGFFPGAAGAPENNKKITSNNQQTTQGSDTAKISGHSVTHTQPKTNASVGEATSIRVNIEKVDQMINLVGELVITEAMLAQTVSEVDPVIYEKLQHGMSQLERNTRDLQEAVMSIRMMPIGFVFSRYPRLVRDLATKLDKKVELKTVGEGTELDKSLIEKMADPLTHLVRNSLDHGIEAPEKRIAAGKRAKGTITLRAFHQGGSIVIEVGDDGAGLNRDKILAIARERGLSVSDDMTDQEVWMLIFEPGFSTADKVTDVSGRGVGMDVVKRNIHDMGGRIDIESVFGVGTRITIRLPLTLAILDGLSVVVGDQMFIVPLTYIIESLQLKANDIKTIGGKGRVVQVRGEYLPVIALHEVFNIRPNAKNIEDGILVILDAEGQKAALLVDALVGQHQVVIKSLESNYRRVDGVSGATIMGDGKVALILDATGLVVASHK